MLTIIDNQASEYRITGYLADGITSGDTVITGTLEDAIATAQCEWCEDQYSATIYDANSMATLIEIDREGKITLALKSGWQIAIA